MRGGALVPLVWAGLLLLLAAINAIWTQGDLIQSATFLAAIGSVLALAILLIGLSPQARRTGAPEASTSPEAVPSTSLASMIAGLALGMFAFGFAFGQFPIFFGAGLLIVSLGRLIVELRAQRRAVGRLTAADERRVER